jgi:hypothetical protein
MSNKMISRALIVTVLLSAPLLALADDGDNDREGLVVDKVLVKGPSAEGVEIELRYWLVDVESLPGHPSKTTLIMDETTHRGVMLKKLQAIASPVSEGDLEESPSSSLTFWDDTGSIRPGHPVSVAVAGLVAKHVVPEAGPGFVEEALDDVQAELEKAARKDLPEGATLDVLGAVLGGDGGLLQVQFRTTGIEELSAGGEYSYVLDPATGERFNILRVPRLGMMAPKHLGEYEAGSYMVINVPTGKIKRGQKITVVVEGLRQEDVIVE